MQLEQKRVFAYLQDGDSRDGTGDRDDVAFKERSEGLNTTDRPNQWRGLWRWQVLHSVTARRVDHILLNIEK